MTPTRVSTLALKIDTVQSRGISEPWKGIRSAAKEMDEFIQMHKRVTTVFSDFNSTPCPLGGDKLKKKRLQKGKRLITGLIEVSLESRSGLANPNTHSDS